MVALDHRGHGRGIRSQKTFRLEDCADDAVAVARRARHRPFIPVGYSMGGPVAQLIWRRHRERGRRPGAVRDGGVLLDVAARSGSGSSALRAGRHRPAHAGAGDAVADRPVLPAAQGEEVGAVGDGARRRTTTGAWCSRRAGRSAASRRVEWIGEIDVPTSTSSRCATASCRFGRQTALFEAIPDAEAFRVDGDHDAVVANAERVRADAAPGRSTRSTGRARR